MQSASHSDIVRSGHICSLTCDDGYVVRYRRWPAHGPAAGTIILVNGMMSHSGWFLELAELLSGLGLNVIGADRRGTGMNQISRGDAPSGPALVSDLFQLVEIEAAGLPAYLVGWSWGAIPAVHAALELGTQLSGLVLLAPGLFPAAEVRRVVAQEYAARGDMPDDFPGLPSPLTPEMFSGREDVREFIRHDSLTQRAFTPRFFRISGEMSFSANLRLPQLRLPVLLLLASQDQTADNQRTLKAIQRLDSSLATIATLECQHAMQFEAPGQITNHIELWMRRCAQPLKHSA